MLGFQRWESLAPPLAAAHSYQLFAELGKRPHHWRIVKNGLQKQESSKCVFVTGMRKAVIARKLNDTCQSIVHHLPEERKSSSTTCVWGTVKKYPTNTQLLSNKGLNLL